MKKLIFMGVLFLTQNNICYAENTNFFKVLDVAGAANDFGFSWLNLPNPKDAVRIKLKVPKDDVEININNSIYKSNQILLLEYPYATQDQHFVKFISKGKIILADDFSKDCEINTEIVIDGGQKIHEVECKPV